MTRRRILQACLTLGIWNVLRSIGFAAPPPSMDQIEKIQKNWKALLPDGIKPPLASEPLKLSKQEWRKRLSAAQFDVLREEGCERIGAPKACSLILPLPRLAVSPSIGEQDRTNLSEIA